MRLAGMSPDLVISQHDWKSIDARKAAHGLNQRLTARFPAASQPCLVTQVGRGGVFVSTPQAVEAHRAMPCEVELPEFGQSFGFEGEVLYTSDAQCGARQGLWLRFFDISCADEDRLIEYLGRLESRS